MIYTVLFSCHKTGTGASLTRMFLRVILYFGGRFCLPFYVRKKGIPKPRRVQGKNCSLKIGQQEEKYEKK